MYTQVIKKRLYFVKAIDDFPHNLKDDGLIMFVEHRWLDDKVEVWQALVVIMARWRSGIHIHPTQAYIIPSTSSGLSCSASSWA